MLISTVAHSIKRVSASNHITEHRGRKTMMTIVIVIVGKLVCDIENSSGEKKGLWIDFIWTCASVVYRYNVTNFTAQVLVCHACPQMWFFSKQKQGCHSREITVKVDRWAGCDFSTFSGQALRMACLLTIVKPHFIHLANFLNGQMLWSCEQHSSLRCAEFKRHIYFPSWVEYPRFHHTDQFISELRHDRACVCTKQNSDSSDCYGNSVTSLQPVHNVQMN